MNNSWLSTMITEMSWVGKESSVKKVCMLFMKLSQVGEVSTVMTSTVTVVRIRKKVD